MIDNEKVKKCFIVLYILLWAMSFFQYFFILSQSFETAQESSAQSLSISEKISKSISEILDKKSEADVNHIKNIVHHIIRKMAHVAEFYIYAFLNIMIFFVVYRKGFKKVILMTFFVGVIGASLDEFVQIFIPGRAGQFGDVIIDSVGTSGACLFFVILVKIFKCRIKKEVIL